MFDLGAVDMYMHYHQNELLREAEHDRLVLQALGRHRPFRARVADGLRSLADRIDDERPVRPVRSVRDELAAA